MPSFPPGTVILDRYEIKKAIGAGGYGEVFLAVQLSTGQPVAIKALKRERLVDDNPEREIERFNREMRVIGALNHPHIVDLKDFAEWKDNLLMILEFVDGKNMAHSMAVNGPMSPALVARIIGQVLEALVFAHGRGIIHRDLKPANIMLTGSPGRPMVKVLDFGIATVFEDPREGVGDMDDWEQLTETDVVLGTTAYMAPEQLQHGHTSPQSDVYAVGLLCFEMLTGTRAVTGTTSVDIAIKQIYDDLPIPPDIDACALGPILRRATAKDPADRYLSAESMLADLERANVDDLPVFEDAASTVRQLAAASIGPTRITPPKKKKGPVYLSLAIAALILVGGGVAATLLLDSDDKPSADEESAAESSADGQAGNESPSEAASENGRTANLSSRIGGEIIGGMNESVIRLLVAVHDSLDRLTSIYAAMAELEKTGNQLLDTFCDCYADQAFQGDDAACRRSYDLPGELECGRQVYPEYKEAAVRHMECLRIGMDVFRKCVSSCPDLLGDEAQRCIQQTTADSNACRKAAPMGMVTALDQCTGVR